VEVADSLLVAADEVLRRDGLESLSARVVADRAGVGKMGIYSRFGSMDGLIDALLIRYWDDIAHTVEAAARQHLNANDRVMCCAHTYRAWALANPKCYEAMFMTARSFASEAVTEHATRAFEVLIRIVEYAMAAGLFAADDPEEISQLAFSVAHGAVSLEIKGDTLAGDGERIYSRMLSTFLRGLSP
jgi:AcrR family transcriptional regulator